jgi:putative ABC transport system permease protein
MKFWKLIWKNVTRNKKRTVLTVLSIGFSLFLVSVLRTLVLELTRENPAPAAARRAVTHRATSLQELMPESYLRKIERIPNVELVAAMDWFGGVYKDPQNFFANFSVDADKLFALFPEIRLEEAAKQAFISQKTAAVCGIKLAQRFGWKVGDKMTLVGTIYPVDLEFSLVGIYRNENEENSFYFHRDYLEEAQGRPGKAGAFYILARTPAALPQVISEVDAMFRNSDAETLTETESAFLSGFTQMLGNVKTLVLSISTVVVFMILLIAGNTMAMNIRERTHEIAILKSLGFQNESLIGILVGESTCISMLGGFLGCCGAKLVCQSVDWGKLSMGFITDFQVGLPTLAMGFSIALVVGVVCGGIPALRVSRLTVSEGLRRIG